MEDKTADEMFEELGYEKDFNLTNENVVVYSKGTHDITFLLHRKQIDSSCGIGSEFISVEELQAINKKCKEMNWI